MGVVYKARDPLLDRIVAVKTIGSPRGVGRRVRDAYLERFEREAKAAAKMQHPSIVTIFDVGLDNNAPFMVLEYLPGETLADRLDRVRMPLNKAVQIALELASALAFAHKQRIVHRDMKPANVLHAGDDRWKLADFGIARMPDSDLTQVGIFMGTPGYSPPEAIREGRYTPQADVFAWGAVLYELLTGAIPYEGPDTQTTNSYVLKDQAPVLSHYDPSVPKPLEDVTMRALGASTEMRFRDGAEAEHALRKAWENCLRGNLVSTESLAGTEVPHEKLNGPMHGEPPPRSLDASDSMPSLRGDTAARAAEGSEPMLVIKSNRNSIPDDEPTRIMVRESDDDLTETSERPKSAKQDNTEIDYDAQKKAEATDVTRRRSTAAATTTRWGVWLLLVVAAVVAGILTSVAVLAIR